MYHESDIRPPSERKTNDREKCRRLNFIGCGVPDDLGTAQEGTSQDTAVKPTNCAAIFPGRSRERETDNEVLFCKSA
ncbi:hypothetical protein KCP69_09020 [Salmonella enterica subsp. enterica]|nr:hypothetical protein KCP69_09020 [Salmonella enterica subsp. enterica]